MAIRGPKRLGKSVRLTIEIYPQLDEAIRRVCEERGIGIGDLISSCVARELNVSIPPPRVWGTAKPVEQMELSDA